MDSNKKLRNLQEALPDHTIKIVVTFNVYALAPNHKYEARVLNGKESMGWAANETIEGAIDAALKSAAYDLISSSERAQREANRLRNAAENIDK